MKKKIIPLFLLLCFTLVSCNDYAPHYNNNSGNTNKNNNYEKQTEEEKPTETTIDYNSLSEDEYKAQCIELFYDEVFFGNDDLEGDYVKLDIMLSEKYYFTSDDLYKDSFQKLAEGRKINQDFYKCCVLRKDENSYVGQQIELWFDDNYGLLPDNYNTGQKIIVYGEVISWSNNTWNGYNIVRVIPKYIEAKPQ